MRTGLLNKPIDILRPQVTINDYGEKQMDYIRHYHCRARVTYTGGSRTIENQEIIYPYTVNFEIWKHVDIDENDRIEYNKKQYRILNITVYDSQNKKVINTEEVNE